MHAALRLLVPCGLLLCSGLSCAADVAMGGVVPGTMLRKSVVSVREARFRNLVPQATDYSCGAAALATVLRYGYGLEISEQETLRGLLQNTDAELVRTRGFSMLDLKNYAGTLGFDARGFEVRPEALEKIRVPTIVLLDIKGYRHFVVLRRVVDGRVHVADPALGNREMRLADFLAAWNGILLSIMGKGYERDNVLVAVAPRPEAARMLSLDALSRQIPGLDFYPTNLIRF